MGVLAVEARTLWRLLIACEQAGLRVPDDVAIICGANDDDIFEAFAPTITGVRYDNERIGYLAAEALHRQMDGRAAEAVRVVAPLGVVSRASTNLLAIDDETVREAVRFIRGNVSRGLCVGDILEAFPVARRSLGRRMQAVLGHGPSEEIRRSRSACAKHLLTMTDLSLMEVARRSGYASQSQMGRYVKEATGLTPAAIRRNNAKSLWHIDLQVLAA